MCEEAKDERTLPARARVNLKRWSQNRISRRALDTPQLEPSLVFHCKLPEPELHPRGEAFMNAAGNQIAGWQGCIGEAFCDETCVLVERMWKLKNPDLPTFWHPDDEVREEAQFCFEWHTGMILETESDIPVDPRDPDETAVWATNSAAHGILEHENNDVKGDIGAFSHAVQALDLVTTPHNASVTRQTVTR